MVSSCADKLYRVKYRRESTESVSKCLGVYTQAASTVNQTDESLDFTRMDKLFIHNMSIHPAVLATVDILTVQRCAEGSVTK